MTEDRGSRQPGRRKWTPWSGVVIALLAGGVLLSVLIVSLLVSLLSLSPSLPEGEGEAHDVASAEPRPGPSGPAPGSSFTLASGERVEISAASLRGGDPLVLNLRLPAPPRGVELLSVRVMSEDGRVLELDAAVGKADRAIATVEIAGAWLASTGRYMVELRTLEPSHFPIRRYVVEVR